MIGSSKLVEKINKGLFIIMRWIGGVQGYFFSIFNPYVLRARSNSHFLLKFINFGFSRPCSQL